MEKRKQVSSARTKPARSKWEKRRTPEFRQRCVALERLGDGARTLRADAVIPEAGFVCLFVCVCVRESVCVRVSE